MHESSSDAELLHAWRRGDARAFDALYARHRVPLFNFLLAHSGRRREEVEDVFQETWFKVIRSAGQHDASQPFRPWLYRIARNCLVDRWRHLSVVEAIHVSDDIAMQAAGSDGSFRPERALHAADLDQHWRHALATLPALQREVLLLKLEGDFSLDELAAITGAERETVKSRLRYATAKLRERLDGVLDD